MYKNSDSYELVSKIILSSYPLDISLKKRIEGDILIVTSQENNFFFLNDIAKSFLLLCHNNNDVKTIINLLYKDYDIEYDILVNDVIDLIEDLQYKRIIYLENKKWI